MSILSSALKAAKKKRTITEDELRSLTGEVDALVEAATKQVVGVVAAKEQQILAV